MSSRRKAQRRSARATNDGARSAQKGRPAKQPAAQKGRPAKQPAAQKGRPAKSPPARPALSRARERLSAAWRSFWESQLAGAPRVSRPLTPITRRDLAWAGATGVASAVLFSTIITSYPGLGDAPETVAGVSSLGVLHSPGYPAYVLIAKAFTLLVPIGSEAFRVNLFSLVCASLSVAGVQLLARRCGAARWACTLGALTLAASAGFWFYAGFAKHDTFSGLVFLVSLYLALSCRERPTTRNLVGLAAAIAVGLGSSWPLEVLILPSAGFVLVSARRELPLRGLATATATGIVLVVAIYGFVMFRAAENPPLNWGDATTISRLIQLVDRADFTPHGSSGESGSSGSASVAPARAAGAGPIRSASTTGAAKPTVVQAAAPPRAAETTDNAGVTSSLGGYVGVFLREFELLGLLLAAWGLIVSLRGRRTNASYALVVTFVVNVLGAAATVGPGSSGSYDLDLIEEGFLLGCFFVLACWLAIGAEDLVVRMSAGGWLERLRAGAARRFLEPAAALVLGAALLVPSVISHWPVAHRDDQPYADRYAATMFSELPRRAVVFIFGAELSQPLVYRQVVFHERPDVIVVAADGLSYKWYRRQLSRRLGRPLPPAVGNSITDAANVVKSLRGVRPVYLDPQATQNLQGLLGYRPVGLLSQLAGGTGPTAVSSPSKLDQTVRAAERSAGLPAKNWNLWPNDYLALATYSTAALDVARAYYEQHDSAGLHSALLNVLSVQPQDKVAINDLAALGGGSP